MLEVTESAPKVVQLSSMDSEDDLWGKLSIAPTADAEGTTVVWQAGLLGSEDRSDELRLLVIPDLAKLSLAGARACVSLMGASVAHLERHGQRQYWQPNLCWLAGCAKEQIGAVSPHLLDRFALRLTGKVLPIVDRVGTVLNLLEAKQDSENVFREELSSELRQSLKQATGRFPKLTLDSLKRVETYTSVLEVYSPRRSFTLARLALTHAQLTQTTQVTAAQVDKVAEIIGLQLPLEDLETLDTPQLSQSQESAWEDEQAAILPQTTHPKSTLVADTGGNSVPRPVYAPDQTKAFGPKPLIDLELPSEPYPEDVAPIDREVMSLKLPPRRFQMETVGRGLVIGVEPTRTTQDLALVSTLTEAAKYQSIRRQRIPEQSGKLTLSSADLRCYRRAPIAEQMLVLVIDHTCLRKCQWQDTLLPYLSWAYQERASVCLVQVGMALNKKKVNGKINASELRASKMLERSILVPRISAGIESPAGRTTPLAHGLESALQTLRHALQHGRSQIQQATLVVLTDGRGNVPLKISHSGNIEPFLQVKQQGIDDALMIAKQIGQLNGVNSILLNPQPIYYPKLPLELARAMQARTVNIPPPLEDLWEVNI
ncbi:MAG: hypothetical protein F6K00_26890 [Leptolyngbya sp. SIOISBB]|nr:hypothetical protein [Leptolyngbya sp. SIOISBB]